MELTPRETEVLKLVCEEQSSKAIANNLGLSKKTIETHRLRIYRKIDVKTSVGMVRWAIRTGLVLP